MVIVPIVEGQGEVQAVPNLLHRIVAFIAPDALLQVSAHPRQSRFISAG